ncbi:ABC transporter substrate-binding protein [Nitratifractor salsuginis]|uniref:Sulfonate/nitrate ABC transporter, substrate-binding protein n=1 Tax=Nitratifractor salsuginis (strain DSM 16511 / JCM 12458 / E9I37-1) TaxID=749222 RepID=E6X213_NITSE|nr:ABC transporter substrate-binding protein [Nitratifractor salsuginis]ADV47082.1 sulfonate/nitrate ABC transporter, substrate-binding protein [Nitratifractor salsuginis DSM 16511]
MLKRIMGTMLLLASTLLMGADKVDKIVIAGPAANVSHPIFRMIESGALKDVAKKVEFRLWNNPDQLRAMIINKEVDFVAVPTNVAAILYNKKQPIQMLNVSIWGILQILVRDQKIDSLAKLKGQSLVVPWRGDMPDIVLRSVMKKEGLSQKDLKIIYVSNPMDAAQQLIMRRQDNALLPEPAVSMVLRKTHSFPVSIIAPELYRGIDLQKEWGKAFGVEPKIAQAGMAVVGKMRSNSEIVSKFEKAYEAAMAWYKKHPKEAGDLVVKYTKMFTPEAVADSIGHVKMKVVPAKAARKDVEFFFEKLKENDPKIIGGKLPDEGFYR